MKLVKFTEDVINPIRNEIQALRDRANMTDKELAHFKKFEKMT